MAEFQTVCTQADVLPGRTKRRTVRVVFGITYDGAAHMRELYADLMMASGLQTDIKLCPAVCRQGRRVFWRKEALSVRGDGIMQPCKLRTGDASAADA